MYLLTRLLANQFRALEEDEVMFLDSIREQQLKEERQRKEMDGEEVKGFRQCVSFYFSFMSAYRHLLFQSCCSAVERRQ